ncbi:hypothetical protein E3E36_12190, partial [Thermococcus sp. M36]|uniref:esterase-like activity of phytase family protein n=1 Tax=Thermococcus sp. M36 TaxID=1638261 RepID=UPI0014396049
MQSICKKIVAAFIFYLFTFHFATAQKISKLNFLSEYTVPHNLQFKGTTVGGLSGIDYDAKNNLYYIISDDRSAINAARYYTAKIFFSNNKIDSVVFVDV